LYISNKNSVQKCTKKKAICGQNDEELEKSGQFIPDWCYKTRFFDNFALKKVVLPNLLLAICTEQW
jgi:hypothetical protein